MAPTNTTKKKTKENSLRVWCAQQQQRERGKKGLSCGCGWDGRAPSTVCKCDGSGSSSNGSGSSTSNGEHQLNVFTFFFASSLIQCESKPNQIARTNWNACNGSHFYLNLPLLIPFSFGEYIYKTEQRQTTRIFTSNKFYIDYVMGSLLLLLLVFLLFLFGTAAVASAVSVNDCIFFTAFCVCFFRCHSWEWVVSLLLCDYNYNG